MIILALAKNLSSTFSVEKVRPFKTYLTCDRVSDAVKPTHLFDFVVRCGPTHTKNLVELVVFHLSKQGMKEGKSTPVQVTSFQVGNITNVKYPNTMWVIMISKGHVGGATSC